AARRKAAKPATRRPRRTVAPPPSVSEPDTVPAQFDAQVTQEEPRSTTEAAEPAISAPAAAESQIPPSFASDIEPVVIDAVPMRPSHASRRNLIQRVRDWLRRAA
ncbi:hypothetical protein I6F36_38620, partial [Bradyrhizobium sp. BRP19]|nr:hypothetical protein [Bradyrhizobium sp. BRP19]